MKCARLVSTEMLRKAHRLTASFALALFLLDQTSKQNWKTFKSTDKSWVCNRLDVHVHPVAYFYFQKALCYILDTDCYFIIIYIALPPLVKFHMTRSTSAARAAQATPGHAASLAPRASLADQRWRETSANRAIALEI